jgi:hypothetical protein
MGFPMRLAPGLAIVLWAGAAAAQPAPPPRAAPAQPAQPEQPAPFTELTEEDETAPEPKPGPAPQPVEPELVGEEPPPPPSDGDGTWPEAIAWMEAWKPRFATRHVRVDFEVWPTDDVDAFTWDLTVLMGVEDAPVFGDFTLPMAYVTEHGTDVDQFHVGSPTLGVHGGGVLGRIVGLWGGLAVSIPTLHDYPTPDESPLPFLALSQVAGMRGFVEAHRFYPLTVPVRFGMGVEVQIVPFLYFRTEIFPVFYIFLEELQEVTGSTFFSILDHVSELELLSPIGLGGGMRFQEAFGVATVSRSDAVSAGDFTQLAFEPFISYQPPYEGPYSFPVFARVGLLIAIDEPLGFGFDDGKLMTVRSSVGVRF